MHSRPTVALLAAAACVSAAAPAAARPYLMLFADDKGFQALDIGDFVRTPASPYPDDRILRPIAPPPAPRKPVAARPAADAPPVDPYAKPGPDAAIPAELRDDAATPDVAAATESPLPSGPRLQDPRTQGVLGAGEGAARITQIAPPHPLFVPDRIEATLISAPLAGAPYGDKLAPMMKQRVEFDCREPRWRVLSQVYADAHEDVLATETPSQTWLPLDKDSAGALAQAALCRHQFRQAAVSRFLNVGEILANYQAAHGAGIPQPKTREQLLAERAKNSR